MKILTVISLLVVCAMIAKSMFLSFRAQDPDDYAGTGPEFALKTHLSGPILSEGLIYGPTGKMTNSFVAKMVGEWDGNTGTLSEEFTYSNGKQQSRKWYLTLGEGNTFTATADDIVGEARGTVSGSTIKMVYQIVLPEDAGGHTLSVTDWLYLTQNGVIMNKSEMRKFGIKVAELVATMRPDAAAQQ
ncbi:hypothetical protein ALP8811_02208 [Aliiroseovarius pelagivivens]|uniref:DUF3833 domain-containing protein n=1 Tax=Aliiroseovarius pelagivivens TaxID=1639690 RepID=A0A2R8AMB2_9RHOB|nr:DUF3833 domain-containing protein [Aliiroseovarius pelagivivens]SPF77185.1 hypothetical protein ALP8811_02208 [Aliiroseovarius pelagivivens]